MGFGSILSGLFGKQSKVNAPATPEYYTDPNFTGTQDFLKKYSENILSGNIPDFYKGIGETMSPSLMSDYVYSLGADTRANDLAKQALSGRARTGFSNNALAVLGQQSANARMIDYLNSIEGKKWLMNAGMGGEQDVRNYAMANQGDKNTFDQWKYSADLAQEKARAAQANSFSAQRWNAVGGVADLALAGMTGGASLGATGIPGMNQGTVGAGGTGTPYTSAITDLYPTATKNSYAYGENPAIESSYGKVATKSSGGLDIASILKMLSGIGA